MLYVHFEEEQIKTSYTLVTPRKNLLKDQDLILIAEYCVRITFRKQESYRNLPIWPPLGPPWLTDKSVHLKTQHQED
jgi:hypothetical protein